jgi:S-adenosylmethionine:tRNA ribosyltransferase-isomerase
MPSAGRPLTWDVMLALRRAGVELATLTHAAGLSSIGDAALDAALPLPERYEIPRRTVRAIAATRARGGRVIAVGTTVVRALEDAARAGAFDTGAELTGAELTGVAELGASAGDAGDAGDPIAGTAMLRLDASYTPRVVDGLISGLHVPGESHFELLQAFAPRERLERALAVAVRAGLSSHELGDACLLLPARSDL